MKKNNILDIIYIYILILSIFNIFPFLDFNSTLTSILRGASFILILIYSIFLFKSNRYKLNWKKCIIVAVYIIYQILIVTINNDSHNLSKNVILYMFYPITTVFVFLIINEKIKISTNDLLRFNKCMTLYTLFSCLYSLIADYNQFSKILNLKSPYDINITSFFDNRNIFGMLLIFGFISSFICINYDKKKNKKIWIIVMIIISIFLFLTLSRSCILFVFLFIILNFLLNKNLKSNIEKSKKQIIIMLISFIIVLIVPFTRNFIFNNVIRLNSGLTNRDIIHKFCIEYILKNNWLIGNGYIKPYVEFSKYFSFIGFHNTFLTIIICQGIIGLLIYILLIGYSISNSIKLKKHSDRLGNICISIIIGYIVYSFFETRLLFYPEYLDLIVSTYVVLIPFYLLNYYKKEKKVPLEIAPSTNNDLISIIIPVYNVGTYLRRCLESVINQTYKNIQIILIDDGSKDNSGRICDKYSKIDDRIIVIHKENCGVSSARNEGLKVANGKYIYLIDGDDYIKEDTIETLYNLISIKGVDMAVVNYCKVDEKGNIIEKKDYTRKIVCLNKEESYKKLLNNNELAGFLMNKIYKKELLGNLLFDENIHYREDLLFNCNYLKKVSKLVYYDSAYCYYVQRFNSALNNKKFSKKMISNIDVMEELIEIYKKEVPAVVANLKYRLLKDCYNLKYRMKKYNVNKKEYDIYVNKMIIKYFNSVINSSDLPFFKKIEIKITNKYPIFIGKLKHDLLKK